MKGLKKILTCMFISLIIFLSAGCTTKDYEANDYEEDETIVSLFDAKLSENNIDFFKITSETNEFNAKKAYYYYFGDDNALVVYYFDEQSSDYQKISTDKFVETTHPVQKINVEANKGLVILENNSLGYYDKIISILKQL